jgi:uncharacterized protein with GYD domain
MAIYITQGCYSKASIIGMINKPEDRAIPVAKLAKAVGGKLLDYYVTFGEYDFTVIFEVGKGKSEADMMAALMTAAASGGVTNLKTTVGIRSKDSMKAMRMAKKILKGFNAAGSG